MRDDDDTKRLSGLGDRRGDLLFSSGIAGAARRAKTDHVPTVRIYLAGVIQERRWINFREETLSPALRLPNVPGI
jgi:hypothetical protein